MWIINPTKQHWLQARVGTAARSGSGMCQRLDLLDGTVEFPDLWVSS